MVASNPKPMLFNFFRSLMKWHESSPRPMGRALMKLSASAAMAASPGLGAGRGRTLSD